MEFRILGALEVVDGGRVVPLGGAKRRTLLGALLLRRNEPVSSGRLADELWGEQPVERVAKGVQVHVWRLRKALGDSRISTTDVGYRLRVEPGELDLDRFERLCAEAREGPQERSAAVLDDALRLWRGTALEDVSFEGACRIEVARLEEMRLVALGERHDAELAAGRHVEIVPELEALVAEHPFREDVRARLALALYRCDRQADALVVCRDGIRVLHEELGLDPSDKLSALQRAILTRDPTLRLELERPARERRRPFLPASGLAAVPEAVAYAGFALIASGGPVLDRLSELASEAVAARSKVAAAHGSLWQANVDFFAGREGASQAWSEVIGRARPVFGRAGDDLGLARCAEGEAWIAVQGCRATAAVAASRELIGYARRARSPFLGAQGRFIELDQTVLGASPIGAAFRLSRGALADVRGDVVVEAGVMMQVSNLHALRGDAGEAHDLVETATRLLRDADSASAVPAFQIAFNELGRGDASAAEYVLRQGFDKADGEGFHGFSATLAHNLAEAVYLQGRYEEAERWCERSRSLTASDDVANLSCLDAIEGSLLARRGAIEEAERRAWRAVETAGKADYYQVRRIVLEHLVETLALLGRRKAASEAAAWVLHHYRSKGDVASARAAADRPGFAATAS